MPPRESGVHRAFDPRSLFIRLGLPLKPISDTAESQQRSDKISYCITCIHDFNLFTYSEMHDIHFICYIEPVVARLNMSPFQ